MIKKILSHSYIIHFKGIEEVFAIYQLKEISILREIDLVSWLCNIFERHAHKDQKIEVVK